MTGNNGILEYWGRGMGTERNFSNISMVILFFSLFHNSIIPLFRYSLITLFLSARGHALARPCEKLLRPSLPPAPLRMWPFEKLLP